MIHLSHSKYVAIKLNFFLDYAIMVEFHKSHFFKIIRMKLPDQVKWPFLPLNKKSGIKIVVFIEK